MLKKSIFSFLLLTLLFSATVMNGADFSIKPENQPVENQQTLQKDLNLEAKGILVLPIEVGNNPVSSRLIGFKKALSAGNYLQLQAENLQLHASTTSRLVNYPVTVPRYLYHRNIRL